MFNTCLIDFYMFLYVAIRVLRWGPSPRLPGAGPRRHPSRSARTGSRSTSTPRARSLSIISLIYIYIYIYTWDRWMDIWIHIHIYIYILHIWRFTLHFDTCAGQTVHLYINNVYMYTYVYTYTYICMYVMYVRIHIYIYIYKRHIRGEQPAATGPPETSVLYYTL